MLRISFKSSFIRQAKKLDEETYKELLESLKLFKDRENHKFLKVHKLHGEFYDCYGFSITHKIRVIFSYESSTEVVLWAIGDHGIYK